MINSVTMKALLQWDDPRVYEDVKFYMEVSALLVLVTQKDSAVELLSSAQLGLLSHLVSGSMEATINAFEKAEAEHQSELIEILEHLSNFAEEIEAVSTEAG